MLPRAPQCVNRFSLRGTAYVLVVFAGVFGELKGEEHKLPLRYRIDQSIGFGKPEFDLATAETCSDAEFLRRVHLDLCGRIPSSEQARRFLDDDASDKRQRLVDELLASPEHVRRMTEVFDVMLMERRPDTLLPAAAWREFLFQSFAENKPWDELVKDILAADGTDEKTRGAARFYLGRDGDVNLLTRDISRLFLGRDFQCNQCHDHPLVEDYLQQYYYGINAFLSRSFLYTDTVKNVSVFAEKAVGDVTYKSVFDPDQVVQRTGPRILDLAPVPEPPAAKGSDYVVRPEGKVRPIPAYSRRSLLGNALADPNNLAFRENIANRLWALLLGRGIVHPVDMTHRGNPPSHPELLSMLGAELAASGFDMRWFLREVALSRTYQRSSELPAGLKDSAPERFAVANLKPLAPEQLAWSYMQATGLLDAERSAFLAELRAKDPKFGAVVCANPARVEKTLHARVAGNLDAVIGVFAGAAGQAEAELSATASQALFLANGGLLRSFLVPRAGNLLDRLAKETTEDQVAEELYLSVLCRRPRQEERAEVAGYLRERAQDRPVALEELAWALLASSEFRFNH
ncbi:MAG: DUF1553 domain-containing protein [Planctomycetota bacterium]